MFTRHHPVFFCLFFFLLFFTTAVKGQQQEIDSLRQIADHSTGEKRIDALVKIARQYLYLKEEKEFEGYWNLADKESRKINYKKGNAEVLHLRMLYFYYRSDYPNALIHGEKAIQLRKEIKDSAGISSSLNMFAFIFQNQGNYKKAIEYHQAALAIREAQKDSFFISQSLNNLGNAYLGMENYLKSIEYCLQSHKLAVKGGFTKNIALSLNNLGLIHMRMHNDDLAKEYLLKSLPIYERAGDLHNLSDVYLNLGVIFQRKKNIVKSEKQYARALELYTKMDENRGIALALQKLGTLKLDQGKLNEGIKLFEKSAALARKIGELKTYCVTLNLLADAYASTGELNLARQTLEEVIGIAKKNELQPELRDAFNQLSLVSSTLKDYTTAYNYLDRYRQLNDSLNAVSNQQQINNLSANFENEKKEKEIELLKKNKSLKELEVKNQQSQIEKQKLYVTFSVVAVLLVILSLGLLANRYYLKKKSSDKLFMTYSLLREKNNQITDSINYAQRLQYAILPKEEEIKKYLPDSFLFFRPRDIVSGDFYWFSLVNKKTIVAVSDCTGHGVPGSLMSMVGNALLNQVINEGQLDDPGQILTQLNKNIHRTFSGYNEATKADENADGMDISICVIDKGSKTLRFAGANHSLFVVMDGKTEIIQGDEYSIGGVFSAPEAVFTSKTIPIKNRTSVFMSTDGFPDQFGGEKSRKYQVQRFADFLVEISSLNAAEQKEKMCEEFEAWKGDHKQNDDVLVWGIQI